jgi:ABC-type Fe3+ transport system substrate-binding protein
MTEISLPVIPSERSDDLHHIAHLNDADLVLFMAGNQFMVMPALMSAFQKEHPENAKKFIDFILSQTAQNIYSAYGFSPISC